MTCEALRMLRYEIAAADDDKRRAREEIAEARLAASREIRGIVERWVRERERIDGRVIAELRRAVARVRGGAGT